jgi:hypothetical protein
LERVVFIRFYTGFFGNVPVTYPVALGILDNIQRMDFRSNLLGIDTKFMVVGEVGCSFVHNSLWNKLGELAVVYSKLD